METNSERRRRKLTWLAGVRGLNDVAARAGLSPATLDQVIKGVLLPPKKDGSRSPRNLGDDAARRIEHGCGLVVGWFDDESQEQDVTTIHKSSDVASRQLDAESAKLSIVDMDDKSHALQTAELEHIPQYDTGGKMGHSGLVLRDQPGEIMGWDVSQEWLRKNVPNCTAPKNLAIVTGFGDSMRPLYNPGDPLLVDRGVTSVDFDAIYFFRVGDEGFIKRLQRIPGNGLVAISENQSYRDWTITKDMDFQVFARVIKVWRGEDF